MKTTLLCVGDIHLGRSPARLPESRLAESGLSARDVGPRAAWARVVDEALRRRVDALLLAGDVVESGNAYFEAYGPLRAGVERLVRAGIRVIGVAGNHDVEVLPRLAREIEGFHLLGAGGTWETQQIAGGAVHVVGWSFPKRRVDSSPLPMPDALCAVGTPTIGLLHCDLYKRESPYAPVTRAQLEAASAVSLWLLGHEHKPSIDGSDRRPIGYLGSLVGLDPTEDGTHGPWLLEVHPEGGFRLEQLALAPLRWEQRDLAIDELACVEDLEPALSRTLIGLRADLDRAGLLPRALGVRIRLTGRCTFHGKLRRRLEELERDLPVIEDGACTVFVESLHDAVRPRIDLAETGRGGDPAGLLARKILVLEEQRMPEYSELLRRARAALEPESARATWAGLARCDDSDEAWQSRLIAAGWDALETLVAERQDREALR